MLMELCDLLHLANHTEKAVAIIQAMMEFNMNRPDNLITHEDAITSFQLFYDSGNIKQEWPDNPFLCHKCYSVFLLPYVFLFSSEIIDYWLVMLNSVRIGRLGSSQHTNIRRRCRILSNEHYYKCYVTLRLLDIMFLMIRCAKNRGTRSQGVEKFW